MKNVKENRLKKCMLTQLNDKVQNEYQAYRETLYHMTVDEVIELSYKTAMMNEFKCIIENYADDALED